MEALIQKCMLQCGFGTVKKAVTAVHGGLLHRMFRVETEQGLFAVKVLNGEMMKRPGVMHNMQVSEKAADTLRNTVPLMAALPGGDSYVHFCNGIWFMVYPWLEGKSVFPPDITAEHCRIMGDILSEIHKANIRVDGIQKETPAEEEREWEKLFLLCKDDRCKEKFMSLKNKILYLEKTGDAAVTDLSEDQLISHRDLDPKNVMWQGMQPVLIDWEAAGYVNPWQEVAECLFYWCDDGRGGLQKDCFQAFTAAYGKKHTLYGAPWQNALNAAYKGIVDWLYYNLKRAAGLEQESEVQTGIDQVLQTLFTMENREKQNALLLEWLNEIT